MDSHREEHSLAAAMLSHSTQSQLLDCKPLLVLPTAFLNDLAAIHAAGFHGFRLKPTLLWAIMASGMKYGAEPIWLGVGRQRKMRDGGSGVDGWARGWGDSHPSEGSPMRGCQRGSSASEARPVRRASEASASEAASRPHASLRPCPATAAGCLLRERSTQTRGPAWPDSPTTE